MEKKKLTLKQKVQRNQVQINYIRKNYRRIDIKLHYTYDADMVAHIESKDNIQAYIKELIRRDMEATKN